MAGLHRQAGQAELIHPLIKQALVKTPSTPIHTLNPAAIHPPINLRAALPTLPLSTCLLVPYARQPAAGIRAVMCEHLGHPSIYLRRCPPYLVLRCGCQQAGTSESCGRPGHGIHPVPPHPQQTLPFVPLLAPCGCQLRAELRLVDEVLPILEHQGEDGHAGKQRGGHVDKHVV